MVASAPPRKPSATKRKAVPLKDRKAIIRKLGGLANLPDQACALTGAAILQSSAAEALRSLFVPLNAEESGRILDAGQNGFVSSFNAQIRLLYALSVIRRETYDDLLTINDIRNFFAHTNELLTFGDQDVEIDCKRLAKTVTVVTNWNAKHQYHNSCFGYTLLLFEVAKGHRLQSVKEVLERGISPGDI